MSIPDQVEEAVLLIPLDQLELAILRFDRNGFGQDQPLRMLRASLAILARRTTVTSATTSK